LSRSPLIRLLVSCLMIGLASPLWAGQLVEIYRADTLVKSQAEAERNAAARATLGEVIVRVSGQRDALHHPAIKEATSNAQNYLFGFSYKSSNEKITVDGKTSAAIGLQLDYAPQAIEQLLRQAQLPVWPAQRPKVLVWLVSKDQAGLHLATDPIDIQAMQLQAQHRGLPLVLADAGVAAGDLWNPDRATLEAVSARYKADAILIGRYTPYSLGPIPAIGAGNTAASTAAGVAQGQGPWIGDWQLFHSGNTQSFTDETPEVKGLLTSMVDRAADYFANQYAITPSGQGPQAILLHIGNITSFGDFKQAQAYFDELAMVQRMEVVTVNAGGILLRLTTEGDAKLLVSTLGLGRRLVPVQAGQAANSIAPGNDTDLDVAAMAELDEALANENIASSAPAVNAANAGSLGSPLMYVWQK
jgi:hypothetical protein